MQKFTKRQADHACLMFRVSRGKDDQSDESLAQPHVAAFLRQHGARLRSFLLGRAFNRVIRVIYMYGHLGAEVPQITRELLEQCLRDADAQLASMLAGAVDDPRAVKMRFYKSRPQRALRYAALESPMLDNPILELMHRLLSAIVDAIDTVAVLRECKPPTLKQ